MLLSCTLCPVSRHVKIQQFISDCMHSIAVHALEGNAGQCVQILDSLAVFGKRRSCIEGICAGLYGENAFDIVGQAGRILGLPLDTVFNLQLPEGNPDELALPFPGQPLLW